MELSNLYQTDQIKNKAFFALLLVLLLFFFLILRLWQIQVMQGDEFKNMSENNRIRVKSIINYRGDILDRHGEVLVSLRPSFNLYLTREDTRDLEKELNILKKSVDLSEAPSLKIIKSYPAYREILLKRDINRRGVAFIEENTVDLPGFSIKVEPMRDYRYGQLASQTLGYLGEISRRQMESLPDKSYRMGDFIGQYGLESEFENFLKGKKGLKRVEVDAAGRELRILKQVYPIQGDTLVLTIDRDLQLLVEKELEGKQGSVVVLNPQNGNILAIASRPSFNPNLFARGISPSGWRALMHNETHPLENRAIKGLYPPGSTYKIILAAAGLEQGVITEDTTFFCPGYFRLGKRRYRCWKRGGHGKISIHKALTQSCDVFFYQLGYHLGIDTIARYAAGFGLGSITGLNPAYEKSGLIPTRAWKLKAKKEPWQPGETLSASIGQGYDIVTPLQLANVIAAVANGGTLFKPHIIQSIRKPDGETIRETAPEIIGHVPVSRKNLEIIRAALLGVVEEKRGTGWRARVQGVQVAGKTGTAQVIRQEGRDQDTGEETPFKFRDHALFVAFSPFENPTMALSIVVEHGGHGGSACAPIAKKIIRMMTKDKE